MVNIVPQFEYRTIPKKRPKGPVMTLVKLAATLAALLIPAAALAQSPGQSPAPAPPPADPNEVLVDELVVVARWGGPAWWRVSDADTTVYVLGVPSVAPKGLDWDKQTLERRLAGADEVILPFNNVGVSAVGVPGALFNLMRLKGKPIEDSLPEALRSRFVAGRTAIGQPAKRYGYRNELAAGILLISDYRDHAHLTAADPGKTIARMAKARKIKTVSKTYDLGPVMGAAIRTPAAAQRTCLVNALDELETGGAGVRRAAEGWAQGDVITALGAERGYERCINATPGALKLDARLKADQAAAIARALDKPGHSVAVVQLRPLLAEGGVLDRLRAQGFTVKTPGDE